MGESYLDWELKFEKSKDPKKNSSKKTEKSKINTLGVRNEKFKAFMKKWRKKNLKLKNYGPCSGSITEKTITNNGEKVIGQVRSSLPDDE